MNMIIKQNRPAKNWAEKDAEFTGKFKKLCKAEEIQIYSTMNDTKAAFPERTKQSLKNILCRSIKGCGNNYIRKLSQFVTTRFLEKNCSIELIPKNVKNSDFLSILCSEPIWEYKKFRFEIGDIFRIFKYNPPSRSVISHSLHTKSTKLLQFLPENRQHTQKWMNRMRFSMVKSVKKIWPKSFNNGIFTTALVSNASRHLIQEVTLHSFKNFLPEQLKLEDQGEVANSGISYPTMYQDVRGKGQVFWWKIFKIVRILLCETRSLIFHYGYCSSHEHSHSTKRQSQRNLHHI